MVVYADLACLENIPRASMGFTYDTQKNCKHMFFGFGYSGYVLSDLKISGDLTIPEGALYIGNFSSEVTLLNSPSTLDAPPEDTFYSIVDSLDSKNFELKGGRFNYPGFNYPGGSTANKEFYFLAPPDYEIKSEYRVKVKVESISYGLGSYEEEFTIKIKDVNETPGDLSVTASTFDESIISGSAVATLSSTDPDADDTHTYALVTGTGDTDNSAFTIDGDELKIVDSPDFETKSSYSIRLQTKDSGGLTFEKAFTLTVYDLPEEGSDSSSTFAEYGQTTINHNWTTISLDKSYSNPVVIASDPTMNGGDPVAVRLRNIGKDSFQIRLQEPNYKDGLHGNETISYVVMESGDWELSDGTRISAGTHQTKKLSSAGFDKITFKSRFSEAPTVLTQTQTLNGADWVTTRTKQTSKDGFEVTMQEEEKLNRGGHAQESIGWIAIDSGTADDGDTNLESGNTKDIFTHSVNSHSFASTFSSKPTLLTKLSSFDGGDVANSRITSITDSGFSAFVQEDQSLDSEVSHTSETLSFFALDGTSGTLEGSAYQPSTQDIGEYGRIDVDNKWSTITLQKNYVSPIVITSDPTLRGGDPVAVRLNSIQSDSFKIRLQEPNYKDGNHTKETISYLVIEEGTWQLTDGTSISAGTHETNKLSTQGREKISFGTAFDATPAVLTQTQTFKGGDWVTTRTDNITGQSFDVMMQEEEKLNRGGHATESIGWIAIDQAVGNDGDTLIEGGVTPSKFTHNAQSHTFSATFDDTPTLLTKLDSFNGSDVANSRIKSVTANGFSALVQEEQSFDAEIGHTNESLSYLALGGSSGTIQAVI